MVNPTRQRILDYLGVHRSATAAELAAALQVTPADIRHHLSNLQAEGLVVAEVGQSPTALPAARGRPARRFRLPEQALAPGLDQLLSALLAETYASLPPVEQQAFLRRLAARLVTSPPPSASLSQRLVSAVQRLNSLGYRARWEARAAGPRLILEHRPFAALEAQIPALAALETVLFEALLGLPPSQIEIVQPPPP